MRELPRKLTTDELAELFEGRTRLVELLSEIENPLNRAEEVVKGLTEEEKLEALDAHPAIGERAGISARSAGEQGGETDRAVLDELLCRADDIRLGAPKVTYPSLTNNMSIYDELPVTLTPR